MFEDHTPQKVLYCYGVYQPLFDEMKKTCSFIVFHEGLPEKEIVENFAHKQHNVIVLDDLIHLVVNDPTTETLFTRGCHHKFLSCILLTQNIFQQGKCARTIALNTSYLILFRNYRDSSQIITLGRQIAPGHTDDFIQAYKDATSDAYGYLVIDMTPNAEDRYR